MTTITIERAVLLRALEALRPATAPNGAKRDAAFEELRAALAAPAQPDQAFVCSLGCTTECLARQHGVPSECPSLPRQPVITPATAQAAEIARLRSESEERLQNCAALVAEVERLRKDAERYQWLAEYLVSDDESYDDAIVAATTVKEVDSVIDNAMKGTSPRAHCFCGVRPQAQPATTPDEQLRKDAERYRWLRSQHWSDGQLSVVVNAKANVRLGANCPSHELLDEAIDSAMKGTS